MYNTNIVNIVNFFSDNKERYVIKSIRKVETLFDLKCAVDQLSFFVLFY